MNQLVMFFGLLTTLAIPELINACAGIQEAARCKLSVDSTIKDELNSADGIHCYDGMCYIEPGTSFCPQADKCKYKYSIDVQAPTFKGSKDYYVTAGYLNKGQSEFICLNSLSIEAFNLLVEGKSLAGRGVSSIKCASSKPSSKSKEDKCEIDVDDKTGEMIKTNAKGSKCSDNKCYIPENTKFSVSGSNCDPSNVLSVGSMTTFKGELDNPATIITNMAAGVPEFSCLSGGQLEGFNLYSAGGATVAGRMINSIKCAGGDPPGCDLTVDEGIAAHINGQFDPDPCEGTTCTIPLGETFTIDASAAEANCGNPGQIDIISTLVTPAGTCFISPGTVPIGVLAEFRCFSNGQIDAFNLEADDDCGAGVNDNVPALQATGVTSVVCEQ